MTDSLKLGLIQKFTVERRIPGPVGHLMMTGSLPKEEGRSVVQTPLLSTRFGRRLLTPSCQPPSPSMPTVVQHVAVFFLCQTAWSFIPDFLFCEFQ